MIGKRRVGDCMSVSPGIRPSELRLGPEGPAKRQRDPGKQDRRGAVHSNGAELGMTIANLANRDYASTVRLVVVDICASGKRKDLRQ